MIKEHSQCLTGGAANSPGIAKIAAMITLSGIGNSALQSVFPNIYYL
jgi:hypothetical protein